MKRIKFPQHNKKVNITANVLRALLSTWNYYSYWWRACKFISIIYSVAYETCYKIVIDECNITPDCLGTPMVGLQDASSFLKGHLSRAIFFLSLRRSDIMLITAPFALRSLWWGFLAPQQGNFFFSEHCLL